MFKRTTTIVGLLTAAVLFGSVIPTLSADEAVDKAFDAMKTYDWGQDRNVLKPIDDAVAASHDDADAQKALASRLAAVLGTDVSAAAKDYACRKLSLIGSADSVPALAALLGDEKLSHMARYALERMPAPEAVKAMRDALPKVSGKTKIGVINSLGVRRDAESTSALSGLLKDDDADIAGAAAAALGEIGSTEASKALLSVQATAPDACLACAEQLLADGKKMEAILLYKALQKSEIKHVSLAAGRGLLAALGAK